MMEYMFFDLIGNIISKAFPNGISDSIKEEISEYIAKQYKKLKTTKNIIYRNEPVDFNSIYVPLTIVNDNSNIRVNESVNILEAFDKIAVIGAAGSGKSTLMQFVALQCIDNNYAIPIFIELRSFNYSKDSFENYIAKQVSDKNYEHVKKLFKKGKFVFILDGYDEINYVGGGEFIEQIQSFVFNYSDSKFLISSRPGTNIESLNPFYVFTISPLNENDVSLFIEKANSPFMYKRRINDFLYKGNDLDDVLKNPLFLSLYILSFDFNSERIHPKKTIFLRNIVDALFSAHDSVSKLGYVRDKITTLDKDELERVSAILAFRSLLSSRILFTKDELFREFDLIKKTNIYKFENSKLLYDLTITTNILRDDYNHYSFPHVLILEYLAATFISNQKDSDKRLIYGGMLKKKDMKLSSSFLEFLYELDKYEIVNLYLLPFLESIDESDLADLQYLDNNYNYYSIMAFMKTTTKLNLNANKISLSDIYKVVTHLNEENNSNRNGNINPLFDMF